ncbi:MAG: SDR family NAD(P)-dependent oxidoreductase [Candidatus Promineifilaceae bacterium]
MFDFTDQVVIVTGANGELGKATAEAFAAAGAKLGLLGRNLERLQEAFPTYQNSAQTLFLVADLTQEAATHAAIDRAVEHFGRIDVLVNTAGGYRAGQPVHEMSADLWNFMFDINARSVLHASQAVIPQMLRQQRGKIISFGAKSALSSGAKNVAHGASKAAVLRLTESMSAELKTEGINVNCIIPGTLDTPANRRGMPNADTSRWVQPEALAEVILFLASDAARTIHGAVIPAFGLG